MYQGGSGVVRRASPFPRPVGRLQHAVGCRSPLSRSAEPCDEWAPAGPHPSTPRDEHVDRPTLAEIDVQATLQEKPSAAMEPSVILGACNPGLTHGSPPWPDSRQPASSPHRSPASPWRAAPAAASSGHVGRVAPGAYAGGADRGRAPDRVGDAERGGAWRPPVGRRRVPGPATAGFPAQRLDLIGLGVAPSWPRSPAGGRERACSFARSL
ncbi:DUF302 domain-containing protein [Streptomonospora wellingtoniae]|uniref:DUF302 domain-containing protein n=1 Tax=Streptomonospora wellingtoniae TaxID=3075544 RepID=A0ABU2KN14_9ACTN|nr:DUF302 domain-containing protein [Streptomonospora sp. DSM 45055]MDT0300626.1 DUF302 domain-containing protein [Streptomonospora sp. DSM 45055]